MSAPPGFLYIEQRHSDRYTAIDPTEADLSQPGKAVLITGAGRGIGRSTALRFAECGVESISICARTASELDEVEQSIKSISSIVRVHKYPLDVTDSASVAAVAESVGEREGKLNVLVNNAGASTLWTPVADTDPETYWRVWEVNMKGPYLMTKHFLPLLIKGAESSGAVSNIINVSSIGAETVHPGASAYQVSKLALTRLTEFTQAEYADKGINAVSIHPGGVLTELAKDNPAIRECK